MRGLKFSALLGTLLSAGSAHAASSDFPVFWVAGDPQSVADALIGVAAFFGNGNTAQSVMMGSLAAAALVGLMVAIVSSVTRSEFMVGQWFVGTIIAMFMFIPQSDVTVKSFFDENSANVSPRMIVVEHVPIGIAYPAGFASAISKTMSDKFLQWFTSGGPSAQVDGAAGLLNPLKILLRLETMYDCSADHGMICENYRLYAKYCPAQTNLADNWNVNDGLSQALNNTEIPGYTEYKVYSPNSENGDKVDTTFIPCKAAGAQIYTMMLNYIGSDRFGQDLLRGTPLSAPGAASSHNLMADTNKATDALNTSVLQQMQARLADTQAQVNDITANMVFHKVVTAGNQAANAGDSRLAAELFVTSMEKARMKAISDQAIQGSMFISFMPSAMNAFSFLFIATAPIVLLMAVVRGLPGYKIYGSWLLFGVWSQSWLPVAALVSYYTESNFWRRFEDLAYSGQLSLANMDEFFRQVSTTLYTGSTMISAVPVITLTLLTGSVYAMTSLAGKATGTDRDYGDETRMPGTDPHRASNADHAEKIATAGGMAFSSAGGPANSRLMQREIDGTTNWKGDTQLGLAQAKVKAAEASERITNEQVRQAQAEKDAAVSLAMRESAHTDKTASTSSSAQVADGAARGDSHNFSTNETAGHSASLGTKASMGRSAGGGGGAPSLAGAIPGGLDASAGTQYVDSTGANASRSKTSQDASSGSVSSSVSGSTDVSKDQRVVAAQKRVEQAKASHEHAVAARQSAQEEVRRAEQYSHGLGANVGQLAVNSLGGNNREHVIADAQARARSAGGSEGFGQLNSLVEQYGGWHSEKGVAMGVSAALNSGDNNLVSAGLGASAALASGAGQPAVASAMENEIAVRRQAGAIEGNATNNALSGMNHGGSVSHGSGAFGVSMGAPGMPNATRMETPDMPAAPFTTSFGHGNPTTDGQLDVAYSDPEVRNDPNRQAEVQTFDAVRKVVSPSSDVGHGMINSATESDQKRMAAERGHLENSIKAGDRKRDE